MALPLALLAVVAACDALVALIHPPVGALLGALDEPAHLATTGLVLLCIGVGRREFVAAALVASVAIDLDHLPMRFGSDVLTAGTTRPYTHSLVGALAITVVVLIVTRRTILAAGVVTGLLAHFLRDAATGGGLALWWPFSDRAVQAPYPAYAALLTGFAAWAALARRGARGRPRSAHLEQPARTSA